MINRIILSMLAICLICGGGFLYFKMKYPEKPVLAEVKKGKIERKIEKKKDGSESIVEVETFESSSAPVKKEYLLGLTLGYSFENKNQFYTVILGRRLFGDLYGIGKIDTGLNRVEAGVLWFF